MPMSALLENTGIHRLSIPTPFAVGPVNVYLVKSEPVVLIDTGPNTDDAYRRLVAGLKRHRVSLSDIDIVLVTHGHLDHMGLLARILDQSDAVAYAHPHAVARWARYDDDAQTQRQFYVDIMREFGVPEETVTLCAARQETFRPYGAKVVTGKPVEDGDTVAGWSAYHVPGHSPSDTLFLDPRGGLCFLGDHVLRRISPNPLLRKPLPGQKRVRSLVEYQESIRRTRELPIHIGCPGHGTPFDNIPATIDRILARQAQRTADVKRLLEAGPQTPYQISQTLFPDLSPDGLVLGLSVSVGHLEVLEDQGLAAAEPVKGVLTYRLADV